MAFCTNCGSSQQDGVRFCSSCGSAIGTAATSPAAPAVVLAVKSESGLTGKILLASVFLLIGLVAGSIATIAYFAHHPSSATEQAATVPSGDAAALVGQIEKSLPNVTADIPATPANPDAAAPAAPAPNPAAIFGQKHVAQADGQCALFSKEELTQVLGTNFTHSIPDATGCTYKGDLPRQFVRTEAYWTGGRELVKLKTDTYAALHQSMINQKYTKAEIAAHLFPISPYAGAGDDAWVDLVNIVTARKGDVGIVMDLRYYRDSDDLTRLFVNTALSRLTN
jgi:hypothetical protein